MRAEDHEEFKLAHPAVPLRAITDSIALSPGLSCVVELDGEDVFAFGAIIPNSSPQRASIWGFGTDKAPKVIKHVTRFIRTDLIPILSASGVTRAEVKLPKSSKRAIRWLQKALNAKLETELHGHGDNNTTFVQLSWTRTAAKGI